MRTHVYAQRAQCNRVIAPVQESSAHERTVLHKQLQDANAKLALAAEALTKANAQTAEMSRMEQVCYRVECWFEGVVLC